LLATKFSLFIFACTKYVQATDCNHVLVKNVHELTTSVSSPENCTQPAHQHVAYYPGQACWTEQYMVAVMLK